MATRTELEIMTDWKDTLTKITTTKPPKTIVAMLGLIFIGAAIGHFSYSAWGNMAFFLGLGLALLGYYMVKNTNYYLKKQEWFKHLHSTLGELEVAGKRNKKFRDRLTEQMEKQKNKYSTGRVRTSEEDNDLVGDLLDDDDDDCDGTVGDVHRSTAAALSGTDDNEMLRAAKALNFGVLYGQGSAQISEVAKALNGDDFKLPSEREGAHTFESSVSTLRASSTLFDTLLSERSSSPNPPSSSHGVTACDYGDYGDYGDSGGDDY